MICDTQSRTGKKKPDIRREPYRHESCRNTIARQRGQWSFYTSNADSRKSRVSGTKRYKPGIPEMKPRRLTI